MGAYLSEPNTQKESQDDSTETISYGASSMQGWRLDQEDAHTSLLNFDENTQSSLFAVYDGHGGAEVAQYCAKYLPEFLKSHVNEFRDQTDLKEALRQLFLKFDEKLKSEEAQRELKELRDGADKSVEETSAQANENDAEDDETENGEVDEEERKKSETELLYDEATMPIEEVLLRYKKTQIRAKKAIELKKLIPSPNISGANRRLQRIKHVNGENGGDGDGAGGEKVVLKTSDDFQKQEEIDINEIKKNSAVDADDTSESMSKHEQDYDEASNLGDIIESQLKSSKSNNSTKAKLNEEELKLSPIRKKSFSTSSILEESADQPSQNKSVDADATTTEDVDEESTTASNSSTDEPESKPAEKKIQVTDADTEELAAVLCQNTKSAQKGYKMSPKSTNRIAKFIADCVNKKFNELATTNKAASSGMKSGPGKKSKNKDGDTMVKEEVDEQEESGGVGEEEEEEDADEDYEGDDTSSNESSEEEEDDDDEDDDDEEEEEEEEEDDEEDEDYEEEEEEMEIHEAGFASAGPPRPGYDSGCTAVVALLVGQKHLYVANAGDSRCVVCRDGKAVDMSEDHKPEDDIERARIEKAGGTISKDGRVNNGLNLSRAIGDHSYKMNETLPLSEQMITSAPDIRYLELDPQRDKFMVLACDGIWNFLSSQEVCDYISERLNANYAKLSQICEELFMHCLSPTSDGDGTGCDNMTCIIVTFSPFRRVVCKLPSPIPSLQANSLKRTHENGKENNGNGASVNSSGTNGSGGNVESNGDTNAQKATANDEDASNISKKLKQEKDARELKDVIAS